MRFTSVTSPVADADVAVFFASFEPRSMTIPRLFSEAGFSGRVVVFFCNDSGAADVQVRVKEICSLFGSRATVIAVSLSDPTRIILEARRLRQVGSLFIDVTTFNRENLFSFLWACRLGIDNLPKLCFGYTPPVTYGPWLSAEYERAHNIVGFSGQTIAYPARYLVCCVGYESERAAAVIAALEPSNVVLVLGGTPTRDEFLARNRKAVVEVLGRSDFQVEDVNVSDPNECLAGLRQLIAGAPAHSSLHIAPFNTKISCLSIYSLWLERPDLRVWNAQPRTYNTKEYTHGEAQSRFYTVLW